MFCYHTNFWWSRAAAAVSSSWSVGELSDTEHKYVRSQEHGARWLLPGTGRPHFCTSLYRRSQCCVFFYRLKVRPSNSKRLQVTLLRDLFITVSEVCLCLHHSKRAPCGRALACVLSAGAFLGSTGTPATLLGLSYKHVRTSDFPRMLTLEKLRGSTKIGVSYVQDKHKKTFKKDENGNLNKTDRFNQLLILLLGSCFVFFSF